MGGSLAILGAFVVSDVAAAEEPAPVEQVQLREAPQPQVSPPPEEPSLAAVQFPAEEPKAPEKPTKKRLRKKERIDFGRFESY